VVSDSGTATRSGPSARRQCAATVAWTVAACAAWAGPAGAADASARALAAGCESCHQSGERAIPTLAGQSRAALAAKLRAFRDGAQAGTIMPQLAKGYTDAQIDAVAGYFAEQRIAP
jgi:cytochrome c553